MRRFALGCLRYEPERFGRMMVGDFLDAMAGYNEGETERIKGIAELVRTSTALIWNTQVAEESRMSAGDLWKFPWDKAADISTEGISEEERKRAQEAQEEIINLM